LTVQRIFGDKDFETETFGPYAWLDGGDSYTSVEAVETAAATNQEQEGEEGPVERSEIAKYDTLTGERSVLVSAEQLTPPGADQPLEVEDYVWSEDKTKLLIFRTQNAFGEKIRVAITGSSIFPRRHCVKLVRERVPRV